MDMGEAGKQTVALTRPIRQDRLTPKRVCQETLSLPVCVHLHAVGQRGEGTGTHRPWWPP